MSKAIAKIKSAGKDIVSGNLETYQRIGVHLGIGIVVGVILQLITEYFVYLYSKMQGEPLPNLEINYSLYYNRPEMTWIPFNDVICIIVLILMLFTKKVWITLGATTGWYVSTNQGLFGALGISPP